MSCWVCGEGLEAPERALTCERGHQTHLGCFKGREYTCFGCDSGMYSAIEIVKNMIFELANQGFSSETSLIGVFSILHLPSQAESNEFWNAAAKVTEIAFAGRGFENPAYLLFEGAWLVKDQDGRDCFHANASEAFAHEASLAVIQKRVGKNDTIKNLCKQLLQRESPYSNEGKARICSALFPYMHFFNISFGKLSKIFHESWKELNNPGVFIPPWLLEAFKEYRINRALATLTKGLGLLSSDQPLSREAAAKLQFDARLHLPLSTVIRDEGAFLRFAEQTFLDLGTIDQLKKQGRVNLLDINVSYLLTQVLHPNYPTKMCEIAFEVLSSVCEEGPLHPSTIPGDSDVEKVKKMASFCAIHGSIIVLKQKGVGDKEQDAVILLKKMLGQAKESGEFQQLTPAQLNVLSAQIFSFRFKEEVKLPPVNSIEEFNSLILPLIDDWIASLSSHNGLDQ